MSGLSFRPSNLFRSLSCAWRKENTTTSRRKLSQLSHTFCPSRLPEPGLAEPVRWALAQSGIEWEDKRINHDDWPALKPTTPYGKLPLLEVDGVVIPQSFAQLRYVGKIGGLYPNDPIEAAVCDAAADAVVDINGPMRGALYEQDPERKAQMCKDLAENIIPTWLANLEKVLESAGGKYFACEQLSIGDIAVVARLNWIKTGSFEGIPPSVVDDFPLLSSLMERVMAEPRIAEYMGLKSKK
ncbi:unnamed protein product [Scytosiphon promiscuus]